MSEAEMTKTTETKTDGGADIAGLKSDMDKKLGDITETLKQTQAALAKALTPKEPPQQPTGPKKTFRDKFYEDEDAAINDLRNEIRQEIRGEISYVQRQTGTLQELVSNYPELHDKNSTLTKRAVEIYDSLSPEEKSSPVAYKSAVYQAAAELDVVPVTKRKTNTDDFTGGSNRGGGGGNNKKEGDLDPRTLEFAARMGFNVNDPKVVESLKTRSKRTNWTDWR